jgi:hypothetical protein
VRRAVGVARRADDDHETECKLPSLSRVRTVSLSQPAVSRCREGRRFETPGNVASVHQNLALLKSGRSLSGRKSVYRPWVDGACPEAALMESRIHRAGHPRDVANLEGSLTEIPSFQGEVFLRQEVDRGDRTTFALLATFFPAWDGNYFRRK